MYFSLHSFQNASHLLWKKIHINLMHCVVCVDIPRDQGDWVKKPTEGAAWSGEQAVTGGTGGHQPHQSPGGLHWSVSSSNQPYSQGSLGLFSCGVICLIVNIHYQPVGCYNYVNNSLTYVVLNKSGPDMACMCYLAKKVTFIKWNHIGHRVSIYVCVCVGFIHYFLPDRSPWYEKCRAHCGKMTWLWVKQYMQL